MSRREKLLGEGANRNLIESLKVERLHRERFQTIRQAKDEALSSLF
jgi:hypothetical protein